MSRFNIALGITLTVYLISGQELQALENEISDDFSKNTVPNYRITGNVDWKPGALVLNNRVDLQRLHPCGLIFDYAIKLEFEKRSTRAPGDMVVLTLFEGSNSILVSLHRCEVDGGQDDILIRRTYPGDKGERKSERIRMIKVPQGISSGLWTLSYRCGLLEIKGPQDVHEFGYVEPEGYDGVLGFATSFRGGSATMTQLTLKPAMPAPKFTREQALEIVRVNQLVDPTLEAFRTREFKKVYDNAKEIFKTRRDILGRTHPNTAVAQRMLANIELELQQFDEARRNMAESLAACKQVLGSHPLTADGLLESGRLYAKVGDWSSATATLQAAVEMRQLIDGADSVSTAQALNSLGSCYSSTQYFESAEQLLAKAMSILDEARQREMIGDYQLAPTLINYGNLCLMTGRHERAAELLSRASQIFENGSEGRLAALRSLAYAQMTAGRLKEAEDSFRKAMLSSKHDAQNPAAGDSFGLGILALRQANYSEAEKHYRQALRTLGDRPYLDSTARHVVLQHLSASLLLDDRRAHAIQIAKEAAEAFRAQSKVGSLVESSLLSGAETPLQYLAALLAGDGQPLEAWAQWEDSLAAILKDRVGLKKERPADGLASVQQELPADAALIGFINYYLLDNGVTPADQHWAVIVHKTGTPQWIHLPGTKAAAWNDGDRLAIRGLAMALRDPRGKRPSDIKDLLETATRLYWAPIQKALEAENSLPKARTLIVIPSGTIDHVPLGLLAGREFEISYTPSGAINSLLERRRSQREVRPLRLLAIGDPFATGTAKHLRSLALQAADTEVANVARFCEEVKRPTQVFQGDAANLSNVAEQLRASGSQYSHLHFATHCVPGGSPLSSALLLAPKQPDTATEPDYLTAQSVFGNWKINAELVVLSSCESAVGPWSAGEGFIGFSHALLASGADKAIISLWKVNDIATMLLMTRFYENLLGTHPELRYQAGADYKMGVRMPPGRALDEAKRWLSTLTEGDLRSRPEIQQLFKQRGEDLSDNTQWWTFLATLTPARGADFGKPQPVKPAARPAENHPFSHPYYWAAFICVGTIDK